MPKLTHVDANNMHLTYVYTSIQSHKNAPSSLSIILCIHIITSQHSCPSYIIFSRSMTTNSVNSVKDGRLYYDVVNTLYYKVDIVFIGQGSYRMFLYACLRACSYVRVFLPRRTTSMKTHKSTSWSTGADEDYRRYRLLIYTWNTGIDQSDIST